MVKFHHTGQWVLSSIPVHLIECHHSGHDASEEYIEEYVSKINQGSEPPPLIVKKHPTILGKFQTVDGQHRLKAAQFTGLTYLRAYMPKELKKKKTT
jgi:hypothetical protein